MCCSSSGAQSPPRRPHERLAPVPALERRAALEPAGTGASQRFLDRSFVTHITFIYFQEMQVFSSGDRNLRENHEHDAATFLPPALLNDFSPPPRAQAGRAPRQAAARRRVRVGLGRRAGDDAEGNLGEALILGLAEQEQEAGLGERAVRLAAAAAAVEVSVLVGR